MDITRRDLHIHNEERTRTLLQKAKKRTVCVWEAGVLGKGFVKEILEEQGISIDFY